MKKRLLTILIIVFGFCDIFSQKLSDNQLNTFYVQTFNDYFSYRDSLKAKSMQYYILKDSIPDKIIEHFSNSNLHFVSYSEAYPLIRASSISALYWVRQKQLSIDTLDITIGGWTVDFERMFRLKKVEGKLKLITKNYHFSAWCGGTLGYIPQGRLVFDYISNDWVYIAEKSIVNQKTQFIKENINNYR
jgi:hypothetical protein